MSMNSPAPGQFALLASKLDEIELELKRIGYWREMEIDPFANLGKDDVPSFLTASSFQDWMQFVFLPNARSAIANRDLPRSSQVGLMALRQWDYQSYVPEAQHLIELLNEFDDLVNAPPNAD
jgi:uncharacterized protein YqcC (DUF446 family)